MFEGKEVEGKIGEIGQYSVDLSDKGELEISVGVKINLVNEALKLAKKTDTPIDDVALEWLQKLMDKAVAKKA